MICASGFNETSKNKLKEQIESGGGVYSGDLVLGTTTHLIVKDPRGAKFDAAKLWKIPIVKIEWVQESLEAGYCLTEKNYLISTSSDNQTSTPTPDERTITRIPTTTSNSNASTMLNSTGSAASSGGGAGSNKSARPPEIDLSCIGGAAMSNERAGVNAINETERNTTMSQTMNPNFSMTFSPATSAANMRNGSSSSANALPKIQTKYTDLTKELATIGKISLTLFDGIGVRSLHFIFNRK